MRADETSPKRSKSFSNVRGYAFRSFWSLNWVGFTKMLTITTSDLKSALLTRFKWPSWSAPIVGTRPIFFLDLRSWAKTRFSSAVVFISFMSSAKGPKIVQIGLYTINSYLWKFFFGAQNQGFMNGKKILFVSSELVPYLPENQVSLMSYESPRVVNSNGGQIRIFMPRYGVINERRHQLHEVIRL